jgi:hypothetical protein
MRLKTLIIAISALVLSSGIAAAQTVLLRLSPSDGLVSEYLVTSSFWLVSDIIPQANSDAPFMHQEGRVIQTVNASDGNSITIRTVVESSNIRLSGALGVAPPDITGMAVSVTMDTRGQVLNSAVDPATVPPSLRGFEEQVRQLVAGMSVNLPEEPIAVGSSWSSTLDETVSGPVGPMVAHNVGRYTLRSIDQIGGRRVATIVLEGTLSQRTDRESGPPALMSVDLTGTATGEFQIDLDLGRIVKLVNSSNLEGELFMGTSENGMPILITSETKLELAGS